MKNIVLLGSTGSIGSQTLDVIAKNPDSFRIIGLAHGGSNASLFQKQVRQFKPQKIGSGLEEELLQLASTESADLIVNAIAGSAGFAPTLAALQAGKNVALANKESMVIGGGLLMKTAKQNGIKIIPIDSEMSAIFQILDGRSIDDVEKIILTASGGPFFGKSRTELAKVTVEDALRHPTWKMGPKVTIDSATLMNKAMEMIETRWLFDIPPERIEVVIHPESIVHSMVQFKDGSVLAQMSPRDMRFAIHYALFYPERISNNFGRLQFGRTCSSMPGTSLHSVCSLNFYEPDEEIFEGLRLAREALAAGGDAPARLNQANELAVQKFLNREIKFLEIYQVIRKNII